ncbi:sigma-54-dependent Fis family transcriptional regulator [Nostoc sp. HG1]|nr:sigma-54-dependent Fis family transcriptional regulator [Nostoc sp. HG1]
MGVTTIRAEKIAPAQPCTSDLLIGNSQPMVTLRAMIDRVAKSSASVMITGASGSGKEIVARAIHNASVRFAKPYVALNCGAIPTELIESELFGHERGAFTGAQTRRIGHFENADKGTLFLDEIGDMRFDMQVKLLRVLEDGLISRVGGNSALPVDVRIVCATHQDIDQAIVDGRFREDLFFRLGVIMIAVPDLQARVEDIPALISHFQRGKPAGSICRFDTSALQRLMVHSWPGNVRELRNIVERAGVLFGGEMLKADGVVQLLGRSSPKPLPVNAITPPLALVAALPAAVREPLDRPIDLKAQVEHMELDRIRAALEHAEGVISEAARMLTLKRTTLIEKMRKYGVERFA